MLNITLPQLDNQKKAKDLVISILAMRHPLSSKKIYNEIKKAFGYSITYQAVHKTILQLLQQGVLVKEDMEYYINMQWIDELSKFTERIKGSYEGKGKYPLGIVDMQTTDSMQMIVFDNFLSAETFNMKFLDKYCFNPKNKKSLCIHIQHTKRPVFQSGDAFKSIENFKKVKLDKYVLVRGDTALDRWSSNFYKDVFKYAFDIDVAKDYETYVYGDIVTQLYIPAEISRKIDYLFKKCRKIEEITHDDYHDIYEKHCKVRILIFKNPEFAEQLRQKTMSYFM